MSWYWILTLASPGTDTSALSEPNLLLHSFAGTYTVSPPQKLIMVVPTPKQCHYRYGTSPRPILNTPLPLCQRAGAVPGLSSRSYQATVTSWNWEFEPY
ncbi:MAG: hypothetical protein IPH45_21730 [Bacteroidales bacterium]|nr:hypothetical protein [Bacteroidales bacterium]